MAKSSNSEDLKTFSLTSRYLTDYEETSGQVNIEQYVTQKTKLEPQAISWNPLAAYHMIRRFSRDLKVLLKNLNLCDLAHLRKSLSGYP